MKVLIISDLHLTKYFDRKKFGSLKSLLGSVDKVYLNGDFWDSYYCSFDDFLNSKWNALFPLLKEKNTTYIYGNHDMPEDCDQRVDMFSNEAVLHATFKSWDKTYHVQHGHIIVGDNKRSNWLKKKIKGLLSYNELPIRMIFGRKAQLYYSKGDHELLTEYAKTHMKENEYLVCGHTHYQTNDEVHKYINSGFCRFGYLEYVIIEDGEVRLI